MASEFAFDDLPHADDWEDRTTRDPEDIQVDADGAAFLQELEDRLNARALDPEVQRWAEENLGEAANDLQV